ncbi:unnamed protein product [Arabis nemorensis]|uniref:Uncharacterized protein n=1 Tax=Arabis nemorensis TaxID=586526 RepID=A0A565BEH9_9BRAS|nr:unnamed protein product [Arabis nemorensis]
MEFQAQEIVAKAKEDLEEWAITMKEKEKRTTLNIQQARQRGWLPPLERVLKCNVDGAWRMDGTISGIGWPRKQRPSDGL